MGVVVPCGVEIDVVALVYKSFTTWTAFNG
jgi:hypothetical protein